MSLDREIKSKLYFIETWGWPLVEVKKIFKTARDGLLRIVYES